ncbi:MAG: exonuclease domain-containing protein, partial [Acidimicrobiales bacterium]
MSDTPRPHSPDTSLHDTLFAVVDVETTGLDPGADRILQMAAVVVDSRGRVVEEFETVVRPESPDEYEHGAEHIHGISREMVEQGMPLRNALQNFLSVVDGRILAAHNARFDVSFLHAESRRVGLEWKVSRYVDTLQLSRRTDTSSGRRHNLEALCEHYGVTRARAHEASSDAKAAASILLKLIEELGVE